MSLTCLGINRICFFFFQAEDGIRDIGVTGVQTCALPISLRSCAASSCARSSFKSVPEAEKKEDLAQLEAALKTAKPIQFKENIALVLKYFRSEERRVGKEGRSRWSPYH